MIRNEVSMKQKSCVFGTFNKIVPQKFILSTKSSNGKRIFFMVKFIIQDWKSLKTYL